MKPKNPLYLALLLTCSLVVGAHADLKYTQTMIFGDDQDATPMMRMGHFVAAGKERNETEMSMGNYKSKEALITICDSQQIIHMDEALKIYAIADRNSGENGNTSPAGNREKSQGKSQEKKGTGKIIINVKVTELKPEKVANWDTKHYMVEMHTQSSGCVGDSTSNIKMELWVGDVKDAHGCKSDSVVDYGKILGHAEGGKCKITYETTGDFARFTGIWSGLVMRQKMYDEKGKVTMVQEVTSLSQAKLDDSIFAVPTSFTKLSMDDYNKQRQQAMMKAMMHNLMGGAGQNAADDHNDANQDNDQSDNEDKAKKKKPKRGFKLPGLPF